MLYFSMTRSSGALGLGQKTKTEPSIYRSNALHGTGRYADESGTVIPGVFFTGAENAAIVEYIGADGLEEMHVFLGLAWFDQGSWAWAHFIAEWGTRGIFQVRSRSTHMISIRGRH